MIRTRYLYRRDGSFRVVSEHIADPSDPPAVQAQFGRHPPRPTQRVIMRWDEREFAEKLAPENQEHALALAFGESPA